jgi:hypothetical protein
MSRPEFEPGPPRWEASTLEKSHLNSLLPTIRNIYRCERHYHPISYLASRESMTEKNYAKIVYEKILETLPGRCRPPGGRRPSGTRRRTR